MQKHISEYTLYRLRYAIGYSTIGLLVAVLLIIAALYVPGGLSTQEMNSAVKSDSLSFSSFDPNSMVDLPYSLLQNVSFKLFDVTTLSIKLPSLILGLLSLLGIILLLGYWFRMSIAVIAALIVVASSQFIFSSQHGTSDIMYIFMPTWTLLLALKVSRQDNAKKRRFWEVLLFGILAASLYTPLSIYIFIAVASATLLHPHLRFIVGQISKRRLIAASLIGLLLISPLIAAIVMHPKIGLTLLGIPEQWPNFTENARQIFMSYLGAFFSQSDEAPQPIYALPALLLMLLGFARLLKTRHTARSYIIISWLVLLAPIILINPTKTTITFVPVLLLIAAGIDGLLRYWYEMFPRNPYARVAGLIPITILVAGMTLTGAERYFYTHRYNPTVANLYSDDLKLLRQQLSTHGDTGIMLLVTRSELPFYDAVARHNNALEVITPGEKIPVEGVVVATRAAFNERDLSKKTPERIITNGRTKSSDRLYLYKMSQE